MYNFVGNKVSFYLIVTEALNIKSFDVVLEGLASLIWVNYLSKLYNTDIIFETIQLKIAHPPDRVCSFATLGYLSTGSLSQLTDPTSARSFIFLVSCPLVQAAKDDFSIRLPWVSQRLQDINAVVINSLLTLPNGLNYKTSIVKDFSSFLGNDINIFKNNNQDENSKLIFKLVVKTLRPSAVFPYPFARTVSPVGFISNSLVSAINFPVNLETFSESEAWASSD